MKKLIKQILILSALTMFAGMGALASEDTPKASACQVSADNAAKAAAAVKGDSSGGSQQAAPVHSANN